MATLVLSTVGSAIGGPVGGAIGALVGNQLDQRLLAPRRQGARLGALTVQTSSYGQPMPKLFGTMRVAGTVIWATDLREERHRSGGGKGQPGTTSYSYSASFAVLLSARPIRGVHRIWADGRLLRGQAGDWKSETGYRLHLGGEDQPADPLLSALEGANATPAYRGLAYAVFEDMQLADFGNRIPSLTFEVEADATAVPLAEIARTLSAGAVSGETAAALGGYAAGGDSVRGAIEALCRALPASLQDDGARLLLRDAPVQAISLSAGEMGSGAGATGGTRTSIDRQAAGTLPDEVTMTYYEPARDYQTGLQRARRGGPGRRTEAIELPAALEAGAAKAIAEHRLASSWAERATAAATLPWRRIDLRPGDTIALPDATRWRIAGWTLEGMVLALKLRATLSGTQRIVAAQPGRATGGEDLVHGPTQIVLLDLPPLDETASTPRLWLAAASASLGWRRATVTVSTDNGASWRDIGATARPATMGHVVGPFGAGDPALFDDVSHLEVELLNDAMLLLSRDDDALVNGANLAMVGNELIQFGVAERLGPSRWRLSRLLRGRRGSEAAMMGHVSGEAFVFVEAGDLLPIDVAPEKIGGTLSVIASGIGDMAGVKIERRITARALCPPSPTHLRAEALPDGGLRFGWTRRSRFGWAWTDGGDVPLGEERERYRIVISSAAHTRVLEVDRADFDYDRAMRMTDGSMGAAVSFSVEQIGASGSSTAAESATFTSEGDKL